MINYNSTELSSIQTNKTIEEDIIDISIVHTNSPDFAIAELVENEDAIKALVLNDKVLNNITSSNDMITISTKIEESVYAYHKHIYEEKCNPIINKIFNDTKKQYQKYDVEYLNKYAIVKGEEQFNEEILKDPDHIEILNIMKKYKILMQLFCIAVDAVGLSNQMNNSFFVSGNYLHPNCFIDASMEFDEFGLFTISNCAKDTNNQIRVEIKYINALLASGIFTAQDKNGFMFRSSMLAEIEYSLSAKKLKERVEATLRSDELFVNILPILNKDFLPMIHTVSFEPKISFELYIDKNNNLAHNSYIPINNPITNGIIKKELLINKFLLECFYNDKKSVDIFKDNISSMLQNLEAPDVMIVLCGKNGPINKFININLFEPLFRKNQSAVINSDNICNLNDIINENIFTYILDPLSSLDNDPTKVESLIYEFITEGISFKIVNTNETQFIDPFTCYSGVNFLKFNNLFKDIKCTENIPIKKICSIFYSEIECFREELMLRKIDNNSVNIAVNNNLKFELSESPDTMERFLNNIKFAKLSYFESAKESKDTKVVSAYNKLFKGFSKKGKVSRYIVQSVMHPLYCFLENVKIGRNIFLGQIKEVDKILFSDENKIEH